MQAVISRGALHKLCRGCHTVAYAAIVRRFLSEAYVPKRHALTNDFLKLPIARTLEAGANTEQIGRIINECVAGSGAYHRIEIAICSSGQIPYDRRAEFLAAINVLMV